MACAHGRERGCIGALQGREGHGDDGDEEEGNGALEGHDSILGWRLQCEAESFEYVPFGCEEKSRATYRSGVGCEEAVIETLFGSDKSRLSVCFYTR